MTIVSSGADGRSVYASGLVTGAAVPGGTCVMTASAAGSVLRAQTVARSTPAAVNCGLIEVAAPAGDWTLTLSYESGSTRYVSEPTTVRQQ